MLQMRFSSKGVVLTLLVFAFCFLFAMAGCSSGSSSASGSAASGSGEASSSASEATSSTSASATSSGGSASAPSATASSAAATASGEKFLIAGDDVTGYWQLPEGWVRYIQDTDLQGKISYINWTGKFNVKAMTATTVPMDAAGYSAAFSNLEDKVADEIIEVAGLPAAHVSSKSDKAIIERYAIQTSDGVCTEIVCAVGGESGSAELAEILDTFQVPDAYKPPAGTQLIGDNLLGTLEVPTSWTLSATCMGSDPHRLDYLNAMEYEAKQSSGDADPLVSMLLFGQFTGTLDDFKVAEFYTKDAEGVRAEDATYGGYNGYVVTWFAPDVKFYTSVYGIEMPDGFCVYVMASSPDEDPAVFDKYIDTYEKGIGAVAG